MQARQRFIATPRNRGNSRAGSENGQASFLLCHQLLAFLLRPEDLTRGPMV